MLIVFVLMGIATALGIFFISKVVKADNMAIAEILLSKGWTSRFDRQTLEEKKEAYLFKYNKYHEISEKTVAKKVKEWDKQIAAYSATEAKYMNGRKLDVLDVISLFGYQIMKEKELDANSDMIRKLSKECEHTGYIEIEKGQKTGTVSNSMIYAKFLLSNLISFAVLGVIIACTLGAVAVAMKLETFQLVVFGAIGLILPLLAGFIPYDNLKSKAKKRQEAVDLDFPNVISKVALLITAGMNLTNAITEAANSGDTLMYQELRKVIKEINQSATVSAAFNRLQCRCDNRYVDKMVSVIAKSYSSGNANLAQDFRNINAECWLEKKHSARRMGETIQTKLFIPTMLMFVGILVVIIVPAMSGFNF